MESTGCFSYFTICSKEESGAFAPEAMTAKLGIRPFSGWKMGQPNPEGGGCYSNSRWDACREGSANAGTQCMNIVRRLKSKIPALLDIREKCNVDFFLCVQANVEAEPLPELVFDRDVLAFCYLTGTKVKVELCHPAPEIPEIQDAAAEGEE